MALTPAPPGPNPGQPGHFPHHDWLELSVKSLALPSPINGYLSSGVAITSTAWMASGLDVSVVNPDATRLLTCLLFWQGQATVATGIALAVTVDGATIIGQGVRGEEARIGSSPSTATFFASRMVNLNPGTSRIRLGAYLLSAGSQSISFWGLRVLPCGWA